MNLFRGPDFIYALRFLRILTMPWEKTRAFKLGVIDSKGNKIKDPVTADEKSSYTIFIRLVFNIRRIIQHVPGGGTLIGRYVSALALIKEHYQCDDADLESILKMANPNIDFSLSEDVHLNLNESNVTINHPVFSTVYLEEVGMSGDQVKDLKHKHNVLGIDVYEGVHENSGLRVLVSFDDIK